MNSSTRAIATIPRAAYWPGVFLTRLLRFLTVLTVFLSPVAMLTASSAQASSTHRMTVQAQAAAPGTVHCPDMDNGSKQRPAPSMDCAMVCAATMPQPDALDARPLEPRTPERPDLISVGHGLGPEAATPPPRSA